MPSGSKQPSPSLEFQFFRRRFLESFGFDLGAYKSEQVERRTRQWMARRSVRSMVALLRKLQEDPRARSDFLDYLTINTSHFFRDPDVWELLRRRVLPELIAGFGRLSIWSAGCSIGAEPYTLAILLDEMGQGGRHAILATDVDADALERAAAAEYQETHLGAVPPASLRRYFTRTPAGTWRLAPHVAASVRFRRHDLLRDPYPSGLHLILCRHVLIYLTPEAQSHLLENMARALVPGGFLVVGGPEQVMRPEALGLERFAHAVYRRTPLPGAPPGRGESATAAPVRPAGSSTDE